MDRNSFEFRRGELSGKGKAFQELAFFLRTNEICSLPLTSFLAKKLNDFDDELSKLRTESIED